MNDNKAPERASERMSTDSLELYCRNLSKAKNDLTKYDRTLLMDVSDRLCELQAALDQTEPPNDPLTLTELRGMDGEPVWCEDDIVGAGIIRIAEDWATEQMEAHFNITIRSY